MKKCQLFGGTQPCTITTPMNKVSQCNLTASRRIREEPKLYADTYNGLISYGAKIWGIWVFVEQQAKN